MHESAFNYSSEIKTSFGFYSETGVAETIN